MLDEVARQLGGGGHDRAEEAFVAGDPEHFAHQARSLGVAALDGGGGQEYLAHQCGSRRQVPQKSRVQVLLSGL